MASLGRKEVPLDHSGSSLDRIFVVAGESRLQNLVADPMGFLG